MVTGIPADDRRDGVLPPTRFVNEQSWWIASELARRHPQFLIHEMHPGGGMYDVLALLAPEEHTPLIQLNRAGSIHVSEKPNFNASWSDILASRSPHTALKAIESAAGMKPAHQAAEATRRTLAYGVISAILTLMLNDRRQWDVRNEFLDSSGDEDFELNGYIDSFPAVRLDFEATPHLNIWREPYSHFWALLRDGTPVSIISIEGALYPLGGERVDLMAQYRARQSSVQRVASWMLDNLPD